MTNAKVPSKRRDGGSSFASIEQYIFEKIGSYVKDGVKTVDPTNAWCGGGISGIETAAAEMRAVANEVTNVREKRSDPVYHFILSWPEGERPTNDQAREAVDIALKKLGLEDHQYVAGTHLDTDNLHVHVVVNRVRQIGKRFELWTPQWDWYALDYACRQIEIAQDWSSDRGVWATEWVGDKAHIVRSKDRLSRRDRISQGALKFERYTGETSFQSFVADGRVKELMDGAPSWEDLHDTLELHGLELAKVDDGLIIRDDSGDPRLVAAASQAGEGCDYNSLVGRLGAFVASARQGDVEPRAILTDMVKTDSTFTVGDLDRYIRQNVRAAERNTVKEMVLAHPECLHMTDGKGGYRFTTRAVRDEEIKAKEAAAKLATQPAKEISQDAVRKAVDKRTMRDDQMDSFTRALDAQGIGVWQGRAGVGKSYAMHAVREVYEDSGCTVIGLSPTNKVTQMMADEGFRKARTVDSALLAISKGRLRLDRKTVIMVDEAGMVTNDKMSHLLQACADAGAKVLLVGDDRQLPPVGRGGMFAEMSRDYGAGEISVITRQKVDWQREAAQAFSEGAFERGMAHYHANGAISWEGTAEEAFHAMMEDWKAGDRPYQERFIFAYTNEEVDRANAAARDIRMARGELAEQMTLQTAYGDLDVSVHDRIQITQTDKRLGVQNGMFGTVTGIGDGVLTFQPDGAKASVELPAAGEEAFGGIKLGYAGTIYKGQGATLEEVYLLHGQHWRDAASYVALTRMRFDVRLFASREASRDWRELARQMGRRSAKLCTLAFDEAERQYVPAQPASNDNGQAPAAKQPDGPVPQEPAAKGLASLKGLEVDPLPPEDEPEQPEPTAVIRGLGSLAASNDDALPPEPDDAPQRLSRDEARRARAEAKEALRKDYKATSIVDHEAATATWREKVMAWQDKRDQALQDMKNRHTEERKALKMTDTHPIARAVLLMVHRDRTKEERQALMANLKAERDALGPAPERETWVQYVERRAGEGVEAAKAALRGIRYRQVKEERERTEIHDNTGARQAWARAGETDMQAAAEKLGVDAGKLTASGIRLGPGGQVIAPHIDERGNRVGYEVDGHILPGGCQCLAVVAGVPERASRIMVAQDAASAVQAAQDAGWPRGTAYVSTGGEPGAKSAAMLQKLNKRATITPITQPAMAKPTPRKLKA